MKLTITKYKQGYSVMSDTELNDYFQQYGHFPNVFGQFYLSKEKLKQYLEEENKQEQESND